MFQKIKKYLNREDLDEEPLEEIKPANKIISFFMKLQLLNPIGNYRRGYDISFNTKTETNESDKILLVNEKKFSKRLRFIISLMIAQSIGFSFAMTASISIPWTFNIVIPFSLDFLPLNLKEFVETFILAIQDFFQPLNPLITLIEKFIKFISTLNPAMTFTGAFWLFDYLGWIDCDQYLNIPDDYNNGSKTSMDILAYNLEKKYPFLGDMLIPFLLFWFFLISFFLLIMKFRKLLFELMNEKKFKKYRKKIRKTLLSYYMNQKVIEFEYIQNRSPRRKLIKYLFYGLVVLGIIMPFTPMVLALVIIFF